MPASRKLVFTGIALGMGLILGLIAAECVLRIIGYSAPDLFRADETFGYTYIPGVGGHYDKEGSSYVQINSDGFRDPEHTLEKPQGVYRIAIIGDSYTAGLEVEQNERFAKLIEDRSANCSSFDGKKVELLTFGVTGYSTAQELLILREKALKYKPDLVLLLVTTNNDVTDNSRKFRKDPIPYFVLNDGNLEADSSFLEDRKFKFNLSASKRAWTTVFNHIRVFQAAARGFRSLKYSLSSAPADSAPTGSANAAPTVIAEPGIENEIYRSPSSVDWNEAWGVTEALFIQMRDDAASAGARFVVVTGSNGIQVHPNVEYRERFARTLGVEDLLYPDRRIAAFCNTNSIPVISLAPTMAAAAERQHVYFHGFGKEMGNGHWNQAGHEFAGETISADLCRGMADKEW